MCFNIFLVLRDVVWPQRGDAQAGNVNIHSAKIFLHRPH